MNRRSVLASTVLASLLLVACPGPDEPGDTQAPVLASFTTEPASLLVDTPTSVTWRWTFTGQPLPAPSCSIEPEVGTVTEGSSTQLQLTSETTYTLICSNEAGHDSATTTLTIAAGDVAPALATFEARPSSIIQGTPTDVSWTWTFTGTPNPAATCTIDAGVGAVTDGSATGLTLATDTTYTLTCVNTAGSDTATTVVAARPPPVDTLVQFDDFGYVVERDVANDTATGPNVFLDHGWSHVKDMRISDPGAGGYLYTVDTIPGFSGTIPGGSGRALCVEAALSLKQAANGDGQSDFYLQYGDGNEGDIPADVWFQFWVYVNDFGSQPSRFARNNKFLYPTNGSYPSTSLPWLVSIGTAQKEIGGGVSSDLGYGSTTSFSNRPPGAVYSLASEVPTNQDKLGTNLTGTAGANPPNTWLLTKIHIDTSGAQGVYEIWQRPMGDSTWAKTTEWIGDSTPGFTWPTPAASRPGARLLRMPTTWGVSADPTTNFDAWLYLADFAMATGESALPTYPNY